MDLNGSRFLVSGATGVLGGRIARALDGAGAKVAPAGRDESRLASIAEELGADPIRHDVTDPDSNDSAVASAAETLDGLDGLVVATGTVAFGRSGELDRGAERALAAVNAQGPIDLIAAALPQIEDGGAVVALSAVVAEFPTAGMAAYSASKASLSAYLTALRRERRKQLDVVLDVKPGHMETGFSDRSLAGEPPKLPEPRDQGELVEMILAAIEDGDRQISYDPRRQELSRG